MMTPLENEQRSQGGKTRAKNQGKEGRSFQALLAASRRPLLHDVKASPEDLVAAFIELSESRHWFRVYIVGVDRSLIPADRRTKEAAVSMLQSAGGAIGFLGVTMHGTSLQSYYKPVRRGVKVIEDLDRASREVMAEVLDQLGQLKLDA